jgi:hypothetical protein
MSAAQYETPSINAGRSGYGKFSNGVASRFKTKPVNMMWTWKKTSDHRVALSNWTFRRTKT